MPIQLSNCCSSCCENCCGCGGGQALCNAKSKCADDIGNGIVTLINKIPSNSCITKIYVAAPNVDDKTKYIMIEIKVGGDMIFCHGVPNSPSIGIEFDSNFIQPLCIDNAANTVTVTALDQNNGQVIKDKLRLTLTVVYCENCCST